jgi:xanthine dehydrogenase accessory factor
MEDTYIKALELAGKKQVGVLATIIRLTGSGPRGVGTKFLVMEDGSYAGTIGGGLLEAEVLKKAKTVFAAGAPARLSLTLMGKDVAETDMICGGDVEVFLEPIFPEDEGLIGILKKCAEIQKHGGSGLLVTVVDAERWGKEGSLKVFLDSNGERIGGFAGMRTVEDDLCRTLTQLLEKREPGIAFFEDHQGRPVEIFVEPVVSDPFLYIFGGGHVSSQIVPLAAKVGFKVVIIDDRPEFADPEKFSDAVKVHQYAFEGVIEKIPVGESSYIVIVTRGHIHDKTVLGQCLRTKARYIGMIGSRRKKAMIYEKLLEEGFTRKDLDQVHAPIGLDIGAETPEEIAVSIVAELIQVRAGKETRG